MKTRGAGVGRSLAVVGCAGVVGILVVPGLAQAAVSCSYAGPPHNVMVVSASVSPDDLAEFAEVRRSDLAIAAVDDGSGPVRCVGGTPTVLNTDRIVIATAEDAYADVSLAGGPLAPGATPEQEGAPEIEVHFTEGVGIADVIGTPGPDEFRWDRDGDRAGLNVNPDVAGDRDVDVMTDGEDALLIANGAGGDDVIGATPAAVIDGGVVSVGGSGDDVLRAPSHSEAILLAGSGDDRLTGGLGRDILYGNGGADSLDVQDGVQGNDITRGGRGSDSCTADRRDVRSSC